MGKSVHLLQLPIPDDALEVFDLPLVNLVAKPAVLAACGRRLNLVDQNGGDRDLVIVQLL